MKFLRLALHFCWGLTMGFMLSGMQILFILSGFQNHPKPTDNVILSLSLSGFLWPVGLSLYAVIRAFKRPWVNLDVWIVIPTIIILLPLAILANLFMLLMASGFHYC